FDRGTLCVRETDMADSALAVESHAADDARNDGVLSMLGVAVIVVFREPRWSAWRIGLIGMIAWHTLVVIAVLLHQGDFAHGLFYHYWFHFEIALVLATVSTFAIMEARTRSTPA